MGAHQLAVSVPGFEGTLTELVSQVRRRAIDVLEVSLSLVTRHIVALLRSDPPPDADAIADYCDDASHLLLMKSRALLPRERERALDDDEPDPAELEARLAAYRRFRKAAVHLQERERGGLQAFPRTGPPSPEMPPTLVPGEVTPEELAAAFRAALAQVPTAEAAPEPVREQRVSIADRLAGIGGLLRSRGRVTFLEALTDGPRTREFVIVSFLAVLELLRRAAVLVRQDGLFGDILVEIASEEALDAVLRDGSTFLDDD